MEIRRSMLVIIALCLILTAGAALRLYQLPELLHFADDEGRDMMIAEKISSGEDWPALGPSSSTRNFYLGPIFYYAMGATLKAWDHPAAPAVMVALISVATGYLLYRLGKEMFSVSAGLIMAALWSFSYMAIIQARWAWHPNVLPFFVTVLIWCLFHLHRPKNNGWHGDNWYILGLFASTTVAVQLHATAFLLVPAIVIYWIFFPPKIRNPWAWSAGLGLALFLCAPVLAYELKNNWANIGGAISQLKQGEPYPVDNRFLYVAKSLMASVTELFGTIKYFGLISILAVGPVLGVFIWNLIKKTIPNFWPIKWFILIWLIIAGGFYLLFSGQLFPHYFIFLFPAIYLLIGLFWETLKKLLWLRIFLIASLVAICYVGIATSVGFLNSLQNGTASGSYGVPLKDEQAAVAAVKDTGVNRVELNTRALDSYDRAYQYLLEKSGIEIDTQATTKIVLYRLSETTDLADLEKSFESFEHRSFGTVGLLIGTRK